jgi:hypothetical protein
MKKSTKKLLLKLLIVIAIWVLGVKYNDYDFFGLLEIFVFIMGLSFIPMIILYFYRFRKKLSVSSLHKVFRFFIWANIIIIALLLLSNYYFDDLIFEWWDIKDFLPTFLPMVGVIILLSILSRVNSALISNKERKDNVLIPFIKNNKEASIAILTILLVMMTTLIIYTDIQNRINDVYDWNLDSGLNVDTWVRDAYNLAFMKIATFGSFIIASGYILIYSLKKK